MARTRKSLERRLDKERENLLRIEEKIANYTELEAPIHLLNQRDATEKRIAQIKEQFRHIPPEPLLPASPLALIGLAAGCLAVVVVLVAGVLTIPGVLDRLLAQLRSPAPTPTSTKTPVAVLSPTTTDTPTLTPVPSPTPTPTPYYVEIVVDASERMSDAFEGGTTKMESAWQTARDIARIRAQQGQFVTVRLFGGQDSLGGGSCLKSYSLFDFTNDSPQIIGYLTNSSTPGALLDASDELQTHENIGREIILLTGGEDGCGSTLSVFYNSERSSVASC
jgi:hypothetical protein